MGAGGRAGRDPDESPFPQGAAALVSAFPLFGGWVRRFAGCQNYPQYLFSKFSFEFFPCLESISILRKEDGINWEDSVFLQTGEPAPRIRLWMSNRRFKQGDVGPFLTALRGIFVCIEVEILSAVWQEFFE